MFGLNDALSNIGRVCRYADRFGRTVYVDTFEHSDTYFRDRFSIYFASVTPNLVLDVDAIAETLDSMVVAPAFLARRVRRAQVRWDSQRVKFVDALSGEPILFDRERDHPEQLLVHQQSGGGGGGPDPLVALARLRLQPPLQQTLRERLAAIGPGYVALHIRNTDYRARYHGLLERLQLRANARVFVATDSKQARDDCRAALGVERVFSFAALPDDESPLHEIRNPANAYARNRDSILDLVMLGLAGALYAFELEPNVYEARFSGFSILAANLNNAREVLASVVGAEGAEREAVLNRTN
jgi:hypothetical protein